MKTESSFPPSHVREWAVSSLAQELVEYARYRVESQAKREVVFGRTTRSLGTWLLTILLFPIGILFFVAFKQESRIVVSLERTDERGTALTVSGVASNRVIEGVHYRLWSDFDPDALRPRDHRLA